MRTDKSRKRFVFLCVAPATILFFLFMILPTLNVFRMSLYERGAYSPNETFVGLKNFQHLLRDAQFIRSMQNMILLVVTVTLITFAFALVFAAILTREKIKGQNFFRIIFYIPNILSVVVISGIFSAIYKPENGMLNSIIGLFRNMSDPILWKGEKLVIPSIIIAMVWQAIGYYMVMYMASMSAVPISLYERGAYSPNETFVGLKNFQHLLKDTQFIRSMQNMILLVVVVTIVTFAFALVFAAILTREKIKGQNFFRVIFYIPNILSVVVISGIFSAIYKPENGMLNSIIGLFRDMTDPILWKGEKLVIPSIILAMVWQAVGYYMVMYMASMSSVPASLYESANLDGAGRLTQFFQITIPLIWTNIRTTLTFFIISTINMAFLFVKAMTSGGPNGASDVALSYMYSQKDAGLYGYSMAIGVVIFLFSFALSACVNKATDRDPLEF